MQEFKQDKGFQIVLCSLLLLLSFTMIAPMIHLLAISLSDAKPVAAGEVIFWPKGFNLDVYETIFKINRLWRAFGVTIYITVHARSLRWC